MERHSEQHSHEALIQASIGGDQTALTVLLTEAYPALHSYVARRTPADLQSVVDADDVVQETHIDAFRGIGGFEQRGEGAFERWLRTIAANRLRNAIRRNRAAKRGGGRAPLKRAAGLGESVSSLLGLMAVNERTPSRSAVRIEQAEALRAALAELPDDHREAVRLVYLEGKSAAEAGAAMGRTERAIHNLCFKARNRLRDLLSALASQVDI